MTNKNILEGRNLTKQFADVLALDNVGITLAAGQIHVVLGENGAGKSTLMKTLYGVYQPDSGSCYIAGEPVELSSPASARALGIGMVFQDFRIIPALTVLENIALALPDLTRLLKPVILRSRIQEVAERYGLPVNPDTPVWQLDIGQRQRVEILKVLLTKNTRVLIFDEPTSVLAATEVDSFLEILRRLREEGYGILFITHKLREAVACADRITVMRAGRVVFSSNAQKDFDEQNLVAQMVGDQVVPLPVARVYEPKAAPALEIQNLAVSDDGGRTILRKLNLKIYPNQIIGVAGISGNGQRELAEVLLGLRPVQEGRVLVGGENFTQETPARFLETGVICIPENPLEDAVVPGFSIIEHMILGGLPERRRGLGIDWAAVRRDMARAEEIKMLRVASPERRVDQLSGGNVQRMIVARALVRSPKVLLACYPNRGLDIATTRCIQHTLLERRQAGTSVVLFSEDLNELFELADELVILSHGKLIGPFKTAESNIYAIAQLMVKGETA